jgi:hypothetical protein
MQSRYKEGDHDADTIVAAIEYLAFLKAAEYLADRFLPHLISGRLC